MKVSHVTGMLQQLWSMLLIWAFSGIVGWGLPLGAQYHREQAKLAKIDAAIARHAELQKQLNNLQEFVSKMNAVLLQESLGCIRRVPVP